MKYKKKHTYGPNNASGCVIWAHFHSCCLLCAFKMSVLYPSPHILVDSEDSLSGPRTVLG